MMMLLVLILAGGLGVIVHRARVRRDAVAAVERAGGSVSHRKPSTPENSPWRPKWLVDFIGVDFFDDVTAVFLEFRNHDMEDQLIHIGRLRSLETLSLSGSRVRDADLPPLAGLHELRKLILDFTEVTDAGMTNLEGLTGLQSLRLSGTSVGDAGVARLRGQTALTNLYLDGTKITDAGMAHLEGMVRLRYLWLSETRVGDAGLARLAKHKGIQLLIRMALGFR